MEVQGSSLIYYPSRDAIEKETLSHHRNYYDDEANDNKNNIDGDGIHNHGANPSRVRAKPTLEKMVSSGSSVRSRRKEKYSNSTYEKSTVPPSLTEQIRQSSSRRPPSPKENHIRESANKCIENNFDISSAKSIAYSLVNPCGLSTTEIVNSNIGDPLPTTPSTVGSSFSDESQTSPGESLETSPSLCSLRDTTSSSHRRRSSKSKSDNGQNAILFPRRLESHRSFHHPRSTNITTEDGDMIVFVGNQEYRFPSSSSSMDFASKYFLSQREQAEHFSFVDLSTHSPEEFKIVMNFFENNSATDVWSNIHWKNLPVILPWFNEFQALPLMSAIDTFLLHNGFSASGDQGYRGDINNKHRNISLSTLLTLMQIAFACGLESTKLHARRLLRRGLLEPRKQTSNSEFDSSRLNESAEDIELEWTLQDLQVLAQLLQKHDDLREYLWEVSVIIYLPHDLDISDSIGLVSNNLFPYLLREGMMQMMIVEGIESSYQMAENSFVTESSGTSSSIMSNSKAVGSSFSEHTSCSDITIPTTPSQRKSHTEKEIHQYLKKIIKKLEKFNAEKEERLSMLEEPKHNSLVEDEVDDVQKTRSRREYGGNDNRSATKTSTSRGITTFAC